MLRKLARSCVHQHCASLSRVFASLAHGIGIVWLTAAHLKKKYSLLQRRLEQGLDQPLLC